MILTLTLERDEFASRRRKAQDEYADLLRPTVRDSLKSKDWLPVLLAMETLYRMAYEEETGDTDPVSAPAGWMQQLETTLEKTKGDEKPSEDRISLWLASSVLNVAASEAVLNDPEESLLLEWVTMDDDNVRHEHAQVDGQTRPHGEPFRVGGHDMPYPGYSLVPIELWINCRCTLRPTLPEEALVAAAEPLEEPTHAGIAVFAHDTERVLMIQRTLDPTDDPDVQGTWEFPGGSLEDGEDPQAGAWREFCEETGLPQPEGEVTNGWRSKDGVYQGFVFTVPIEREAFTELNPDSEAADRPNPDDPKRDRPDVTAWFSIEQLQNLGPALRPVIHEMDWSVFRQPEEEEPMDPETDLAALTAAIDTDMKVPWHGVLAPEGEWSGDRRMFAADSLRHRDLPLPLTWQKISDDGHKGNVTVATIETVEKVDGLMRASGYFLDTPEANEVVALIAEFGRFGVSVDADDATMELDEEQEGVVFSDARVCSACIVPIPAFAQAWVALGSWEDDAAPTEEDDDCAERDPETGECVKTEEERTQVGEAPNYEQVDANVTVEEFVDVAPGKTEDGPGWLTHPVDTDRLRDYWVRGPGAAKIGWGTPGDFNRCRVNVAEYVKPQHLSGYCANRHYDALGRWPGRHGAAADTLELSGEKGEAMSLVAAAGGHCAPSEWFQNPNLDKPTPVTITEEGRVFGHIATWGTCHIGFADQCVTPPHSVTDYAYFKTGAVLLDTGEEVAVGNLTIGGGHAAPRLGVKPTLAHYDSTSTAAADVNVGEDEHGIWFAGWIRPGTPDEMVTALRASALSGDWRKVGANLELVAALAVNVPGFGIPRTQVAASTEGQISLVASGIVEPAKEDQPTKVEAEKIADSLAASVAVILEERAARRARMAELAARIKKE